MKAILILINWLLSFTAISCLEMDHSSIGAILLILVWFVGSTLLFQYTHRRTG